MIIGPTPVAFSLISQRQNRVDARGPSGRVVGGGGRDEDGEGHRTRPQPPREDEDGFREHSLALHLPLDDAVDPAVGGDDEGAGESESEPAAETADGGAFGEED